MGQKPWICLFALALACCLYGCKASSEQPAQTDASRTTQTQPQPAAHQGDLDLRELYYIGLDALAEGGKEAPILFPETDVDYLELFYPGLGDIRLKQLYAGVAPVTNAPNEILLTQVEDPADVEKLLEIFHARVCAEAGDAADPETADAWKNRVHITCRDTYVFLAVLMEPWEVPEEFILKP